MAEIAGWAERTALGSVAWAEEARGRTLTSLARTLVWLAAERRALRLSSPAGAFHGEQPPADGYLTMIRTTWGRP